MDYKIIVLIIYLLSFVSPGRGQDLLNNLVIYDKNRQIILKPSEVYFKNGFDKSQFLINSSFDGIFKSNHVLSLLDFPSFLTQKKIVYSGDLNTAIKLDAQVEFSTVDRRIRFTIKWFGKTTESLFEVFIGSHGEYNNYTVTLLSIKSKNELDSIWKESLYAENVMRIKCGKDVKFSTSEIVIMCLIEFSAMELLGPDYIL